ncbi:hypothetical protein [Bacillus sp. B15-48]|uniref:hypothetical protein n=1 Tax=Bacillus sp. B15-48 TaxID=1548601 RepID=UPI00193F9D33|nr:hypothetical protein [Bacillus sp. B15-48]MBM4761006.1 hypothetical protein [Bacillus sp. B15-48]
MILIMKHQTVPAYVNGTTRREAEKVRERMKMSMVKMTEKVQIATEKVALQGSLKFKHRNRISSLIRIQIEGVKQKLWSISPAALQFIGPGDYDATPKRGRRELQN